MGEPVDPGKHDWSSGYNSSSPGQITTASQAEKVQNRRLPDWPRFLALTVRRSLICSAGWYHVKRQSRIDNTASAVIRFHEKVTNPMTLLVPRSTFDRSDDPTLPTMSRGNMRHVGPGCVYTRSASPYSRVGACRSYTWQVPGMWVSAEL